MLTSPLRRALASTLSALVVATALSSGVVPDIAAAAINEDLSLIHI